MKINLRNIFVYHRGFHNGCSENSLESIKKAINKNVAFEIDVHLTKDKVVVINHDRSLERIHKIKKNIDEVNYKEIELIVPTLREVLELNSDRVLVVIEIKKDNKSFEIERELTSILDYYKNFVIKSFDIRSILWFKINRNNYTKGLLINRRDDDILPKKILDYLSLTIFNFDFYSVNIKMLPNKLVERKRKKVPIMGWTIDNYEKLEFAKKYVDSYLIENIDV